MSVLAPVFMPVKAQIFSPGKLIEAHSDFDRIDACTNCHALGKRSVDPSKCLGCHTPLKTRIEYDSGFHATVKDQTCSNCHKDHFGRKFDTVRFDTTGFDHRDAGFDLVKGHADLTCSNCHDPRFIKAPDVRQFKQEHGALEKTFMGLSQTCENCHEDDSPHLDQFSETTCDNCHDESTWQRPIRFDHDKARFSLTGKHVDVSCSSCHVPDASALPDSVLLFRGLDFGTCQSCHEDPHENTMGTNCSSCHQTSGWSAIRGKSFESRFDHSRTGFDLVGKHAALKCASCHDPRSKSDDVRLRFAGSTRGKSYPRPESASCISCHTDAHNGEMTPETGILACESCHSEEGWVPSSFDVFRHADETDFELTGAHLAVLCSSCHTKGEAEHPGSFRIDSRTCRSCHRKDDPHSGQFDQVDGTPPNCETCHTTMSWDEASQIFDHSTSSFPLEGSHASLTCDSCHKKAEATVTQYRNLPTECDTCHGKDDPHQDQFAGALCSSCHDTRSFHLRDFDHNTTNFKLEGAHEDLACVSCHKSEESANGDPFTRFRPLGTACSDCHSGKNEK
jgi:Class III cytochrome C family